MKRCGFTIAELLITLGIIGVVMAMTLPTILCGTNVHKQVLAPTQHIQHKVDTETYNVGY